MDTNPPGVIAGRGPYQRHSLEFKRTVVEQTLQPGASVARIAREHGLNANQVFAWRRLYRGGALTAPKWVAVDVIDSAPIRQPTRQTGGGGALVIETARATLRVEGQPDPAALRVVLEHLLR